MWTLLFAAAWSCDAPYTLDDAVRDLGGTEAALRDGDPTTASDAAARLETGLGCLDAPLNPGLAARLYRTVGAGLTMRSEDDGRPWLHTAYELDSSFVFGVQDLPEDSPVYAVWSSVQGPVPDPVPLSGRALGEGQFKLDGRTLSTPAATADRPHVLQREKDGVWRSWLVDGNVLPPEVLVQARKPEPEPRGPKQTRRKCRKGVRFKGFVDAEGNYCPATPAEQIVIAGSGPLVLATSGLLYLESWRQHGLTRNAASVEAMRKHRRINNRVVAASAATGVVGVGLGIFGITYTGSF